MIVEQFLHGKTPENDLTKNNTFESAIRTEGGLLEE